MAAGHAAGAAFKKNIGAAGAEGNSKNAAAIQK
jgi:hypothetical protein